MDSLCSMDLVLEVSGTPAKPDAGLRPVESFGGLGNTTGARLRSSRRFYDFIEP
jgi:hypothetical protein